MEDSTKLPKYYYSLSPVQKLLFEEYFDSLVWQAIFNESKLYSDTVAALSVLKNV